MRWCTYQVSRIISKSTAILGVCCRTLFLKLHCWWTKAPAIWDSGLLVTKSQNLFSTRPSLSKPCLFLSYSDDTHSRNRRRTGADFWTVCHANSVPKSGTKARRRQPCKRVWGRGPLPTGGAYSASHIPWLVGRGLTAFSKPLLHSRSVAVIFGDPTMSSYANGRPTVVWNPLVNSINDIYVLSPLTSTV